MPIKPENAARYPADWSLIRARIQCRARDKCEECGVPNRAWGFREQGKFNEISKRQAIDILKTGNEWIRPPFWLFGHRIIEIVCTTAHLDHVPEHCEDDNLRFWCQKCHLSYDAKHHAQTAYETRRAGKAIDMFSSEDAA